MTAVNATEYEPGKPRSGLPGLQSICLLCTGFMLYEFLDNPMHLIGALPVTSFVFAQPI